MEKRGKERKSEKGDISLSSSLSDHNNENTIDLCEVDDGHNVCNMNNKKASYNSRNLGRRNGSTNKDKEIKSKKYQECLENISNIFCNFSQICSRNHK